MKISTFGILVAFMTLLAVGCSSDPQKKGPKETAEAFLLAMQHGDYEKAKEYCSEGTAKNLDLMETMSRIGANPASESFEIKDVKEDGEYATVTYDQGKEEGKLLQLRRDDGKWVVVMSKNDLGGKKEENSDNIFEDKGDKSDEDSISPADKYKSYRDGKTAKEVAESFMKALEFGDYDAAMRYGSKSTNEMLDMQKSMQALDSDKKKEKEKTIVRVEEEGEFAKAYYKEKGSKDEKVLKLGKDDNGNWEVIMTKSEMEE
ncbi:MAG: DUF4878 domain-containing protein [Bacteroidia bacterium]